MSVQTVTEEGARQVARQAALLARMEGLEAHARAADARLELVA
jgi:histidinol dehydrogenase